MGGIIIILGTLVGYFARYLITQEQLASRRCWCCS